jgi:alcohol dehydrogenase class IV/quinol monooxygenase YgiN
VSLSTFEPIWIEPPGAREGTHFDIAAAAVVVVRMVLALKAGVAAADARALLGEYARATCGEAGVLRCDVVRTEGEEGLWAVWTVFAHTGARAEHERSAHAAKLRLMVRRDGGGDSAVELVRMAVEREMCKTVWPRARNGWRAASPSESAGSGGQGEGAAGPAPPAQDELGGVRQRLDALVSNVGLGDAEVLVAVATAAEDDYVAEVRQMCERYAEGTLGDDGQGVDGIVRAGVLATVGARRRVTVVVVGERGRVAFDAGLAAEMLDGRGWTVQRHVSVFPDLDGWRVVSLSDYSYNTPGEEDAERAARMGADGRLGRRITVEEAYEEQERERAERRRREEEESQRGRQEAVAVGAAAGSAGEEGGADWWDGGDVSERGVGGDGSAGAPDGPAEADGSEGVPSPADRAEDRLVGQGRARSAAAELVPRPVGLREAIAASMATDTRRAPAGGDAQQEVRVLHGSGAFANLEPKMRDLCGKPGDRLMRVYVVSGWNEARLQPLFMEMDEGLDAGRIDWSVGVNVFGASATLAKVAAGVNGARAHKADIVVGFGGGAVLDTAKAVASLVPLGPEEAALLLSRIRGVAESGRSFCTMQIPRPAVPLVLVAGTVGSGAEVSDQAILSATNRADGSTRRVAVLFDNAAKRVAVSDPRLVIPRRSGSRDTAMGGLQALCFAVDVLLCPDAPRQAVDLAERAIVSGRDAVLRARREPESSDGPARDALVDCAMFAALAREACGGLGVAACLSLALLNGAAPTTCGLDAPLRTILPRITASVAAELPLLHGASGSGTCRAAACVLGREDATGPDLCRYLLSLAEDIGVPLAEFVGVTAGGLERAVEDVLTGGLVSPCADPRLMSPDALSHIVLQMTEQAFEL